MNEIKKIILALFIGFFFSFLTGLTSQAGEIAPELQSALQSLPPREEIPVIVTLADKVDLNFFKKLIKGIDRHLLRFLIVDALKRKAESTQGPFKAFLQGRGTKGIKDLWIINGLAATVPADLIPELAAQPGVESVRLDGTMQAPITTAGTSTVSEWNLTVIRAPDLWNLGVTGLGTVVANMDTGVDVNHPDLQSKWRGGTSSWYDPNGQYATPVDVNGHGTQTMGVIVGGTAGGTAIGVAPDARWIAVKIYNDAGSASYSVIHLGFQWLLNPDGNSGTNDAPDVVNLSWGIEVVNNCSSEFEPDIQALKSANIAVASAAGNYGPYPSTSISPANYPESFGVGALDQSQTIAYFSSRGPSPCDGSIYPEMVAPGVNIRTSDLTYGGVFPDSYAYVSGTSFSAPHVAGAMALLLSAFPSLTISELESALKQSALDLGATGADNTYGYGVLDVLAAYQSIPNNPVQYTLTVSKAGTGSGTVTSSPAGINCGATCTAAYNVGTVVTLTATPSVGSVFSGWSGAYTGNAPTVTLTMGGNKTLTATFDLAPSLAVTYPNGGEAWKAGSSQTITWTYSGNPGAYVKIQLLKGTRVYSTITNKTSIGSNGKGSYNWKIPNIITSGSDYRIKITSTSNSSFTDTSDSALTIGKNLFRNNLLHESPDGLHGRRGTEAVKER